MFNYAALPLYFERTDFIRKATSLINSNYLNVSYQALATINYNCCLWLNPF